MHARFSRGENKEEDLAERIAGLDERECLRHTHRRQSHYLLGRHLREDRQNAGSILYILLMLNAKRYK